MGQDLPTVKKTLIINPEHDLVKNYISRYETNAKDEKVSVFIKHLYEQALLLEGSEIESISEFLKRTNELMK
jgi:molecular chaperone HtpG